MSFLKRHSVLMGVLGVVVVMGAIISAQVARRNSKVVSVTTEKLRVNTILAKDYIKSTGTVSAQGSVESLEQAELRSQVSAPVERINVNIGSQVRKGQILISLKNADAAAGVAQMQALLKAQEARLDEIKKGTRSEQINLIRTRLAAAQQNLVDTKKQQDVVVANALKSLYNSGIVAEQSQGNLGTAVATISGTYASTEQAAYKISVYSTGGVPRFQIQGAETGDGMISTVPQPLGKRGLFIQFTGTPNNNDTWTVTVPNTKSPLYVANQNAYQAALQGRESAINIAQSQITGIQSELDLALAGATGEQVRSQEAAVEQARANVGAALAQLEKTIIRAPIDGTVSALPVKFGELVSPGQSVISLVNEGGLQVKAFISETDLPKVSEGDSVTIGEKAKGVVVRMSPSVDTQSKTVEVNILVVDPKESGLVVGQNVSIGIVVENESAGGNIFVLPLQAVKITNNGAFVFTVTAEGVLEQKSVNIGSPEGDKVEIKSGVTSDMRLVNPVYELQEGQAVEVQ